MALDRYHIKALANEGHENAKRLLQYLEKPERFFSVVLLGNTFANIAAASLFTVWVVDVWGEMSMLATIVLTIWVLLFCEYWPKSMAARHSLVISMAVVRVIMALEYILAPLLIVMRYMMSYMNQSKTVASVSVKEVQKVVRAASAHLSDEEQDMLEGVFELSQLTVDEVMKPKHLVKVIDISLSIGEIKQMIRQCSSHYLLVVSDRSWHEVLGVIYVHDFVFSTEPLSLNFLKRQLKDVVCIPSGMALNKQLANFKRRRQEVSVVVDEYGAILGVLDVHDILEEVVGYYANRRAVPIGSVRFDGDKGYWIRADLNVRDLNRYLQWSLPERATTVGGMVFEHLERIPDAACAISLGEYVIEVVEVKNNVLILCHICRIIEAKV